MLYILETNSQRRLNNTHCSQPLVHHDVWYCVIMILTDDHAASPKDARLSTLSYVPRSLATTSSVRSTVQQGRHAPIASGDIVQVAVAPSLTPGRAPSHVILLELQERNLKKPSPVTRKSKSMQIVTRDSKRYKSVRKTKHHVPQERILDGNGFIADGWGKDGTSLYGHLNLNVT